jgi:hypothetical protein
MTGIVGMTGAESFRRWKASARIATLPESKKMARYTDGAAETGHPICDVDLLHQFNITDDEDNRFQIPVSVI